MDTNKSITKTPELESNELPYLSLLRHLIRDSHHVLFKNEPGGEKLAAQLYKVLPILNREVKRLSSGGTK